jgi:hypothetical protein
MRIVKENIADYDKEMRERKNMKRRKIDLS